MLEIKDLTVSINGKTILENFSLNINKNEIVTLMGPNGIGKSTICKVIMGDTNYKVENGSITYNGEDLLSMDVVTRSQKGIYLVSQNPIEIEGVTNADMLRTALECKTGEHTNFFEFNKKVTEICKKLNIPASFIHRGVNEGMSGGEKKKNELLHLYILEPKLIILDELDSGLDVDSLKELTMSFKDYMNEEISILVITHHISILEYLKPDHVHILKNGRIIKSGNYELAKEIEKNGFSAYEVGEN
ncbi:MAG: Fe-S cluster assembly ATPase SufC [Erysipelotrichales bacterium]|nr:Fe-S cluster assembly ATPase SufC [Erysipelotrichales bacterium]